MKKIISFVLAMVMVVCPLLGCTKKDTSEVVMRYGETVITESMYRYYVATYKARYIQGYTDVKDSPEFWTSELLDGKTGEEVLRELIKESVAQTLVAVEQFRLAGLSLTKEQEQKVDDYLGKMINDVADGDRKILNEQLGEFSINYEILRDILLMEKKMEVYYDYLYGTNGVLAIDDAARDKYYKENYVRFQQIYINNINKVKMDEDGFPVTDVHGNYETREFTDEEREEVELRVKTVKEGIAVGADFDAMKKQYSDSQDYPGGYYFSPATSTNYYTAIVSKAISLEEGECVYVEEMSAAGAFFIKKLPLEEGAYKAEENADFFENYDELLRTELFEARMESYYGELEYKEDLMNSISVQGSPINYSFY